MKEDRMGKGKKKGKRRMEIKEGGMSRKRETWKGKGRVNGDRIRREKEMGRRQKMMGEVQERKREKGEDKRE